MDTLDFGRSKVIPVSAGDNVLVTEGISKDRQGKDDQGFRQELEKKAPTSPSLPAEEKTGEEVPRQGRIIDIVI